MTDNSKNSQQTLEEQAMQMLLEWLVHGQAKPGQALPLREFSANNGMSRTPLRAAAGRLHEQGLLDYDPRYGFTVTIPTKEGLLEFFDLRIMVETYAVKRIIRAQAPIPVEFSSIVKDAEDLAPRIVAEPELNNRFWRLDVRFHRSILILAGNQRLLELWDQLLVNIRVYQLGKRIPLSEKRFALTAQEHGALLKALRAYDERTAIQLLTEHLLRIQEQTIASALAELSDEPDWINKLAPSNYPD